MNWHSLEPGDFTITDHYNEVSSVLSDIEHSVGISKTPLEVAQNSLLLESSFPDIYDRIDTIDNKDISTRCPHYCGGYNSSVNVAYKNKHCGTCFAVNGSGYF